MRMRSVLFFLLVWVWTPLATAATLEGVNMPDSAQVNGKTLVLNGMGLRKKFIVKVYVAGLYLPSKEKSADKILSSDTERKLVMEFVREVEKDKICNAWKEGLKNNSPGSAAALGPKFDTLCKYMADMEKGSKNIYTYVPGKGTQVSVNGAEKGTIEGKDFADALFACWIGPKPPSEEFKKGLLGE